PISQQGQPEIPIHEPLDLQIRFRSWSAGTFFLESIIESAVIGIVLAPFQTERTLRHHARVWPAFLHGLQPPRKILIVADRNLPDTGHETEAIQRAASVEMHSRGVHHLLSTPLGPQIANGLDRTHAQPAVQASMDALAPCGEEIARPAIETNAIDEI